MSKPNECKIACCAITTDLYQKTSERWKGKRNITCIRLARFEVDAKFYCREHAALIVLQKFEEEGKVRRI